MPVPWTDAVVWDHDSDPDDVLFNAVSARVARLRALDPVTTEIVRLRGATQHNCRLCKSRREGNALDAGGSESLYDQIERYETSERADRSAQGGAAVRRRADLVTRHHRAGAGRRGARRTSPRQRHSS